jgi:hypothetical protein
VRRLQRLRDLPRHRERLGDRERPPLQALSEVLPRDQLHGEEADAKVRLAVEPGEALPVLGNGGGRNFRATSRSSVVSLARQTSPMPPAPRRAITS